jgi:integrase
MSSDKLFEMGGMWIGRVAGSKHLYRFWYDRRHGETRRRSLKTTDLEEAKRLVAEVVASHRTNDPRDPEAVPLVYVLTYYLENHADNLPSAEVARRASNFVLRFLEEKCGFGAEVKAAQFSKSFQAGFAKWSAHEFQHSPSYVSRNLSVIAAACSYATKTTLQVNSSGILEEIRLLKYKPEICYDAKWLAEVMNSPEPKPRDYVPTYEELASLLDTEGSEVLRRYDIIALNTWARPEAIIELRVREQVDFVHGLIDLNPAGRKQTKKRRPIIKLSENLRGWLEHWGEDQPLSYTVRGAVQEGRRAAARHLKAQFTRRSTRWMLTRAGYEKTVINRFFRKSHLGETEPLQEAIAKAQAVGIQRITRYTLRHFMATRIRSLEEIKVDREQRSLWLGHGKRDATSWYETHDPEFLRECSKATSLILEKLDQFTKRPLVPASVKHRKQLAGLSIIGSKHS